MESIDKEKNQFLYTKMRPYFSEVLHSVLEGLKEMNRVRSETFSISYKTPNNFSAKVLCTNVIHTSKAKFLRIKNS